MITTKAPGVRARVRAQLTTEIKESARRQLLFARAMGQLADRILT